MDDLDKKERVRLYNAAYWVKNLDRLKAYGKKYNIENREWINKKGAEYRSNNVDKSRARKAIYRAENPEKIKARSAIQRAVRDGHVKPLPCRACGCTKADGHHPDYSKPVTVIWLCRSHHIWLHVYRKNKRATFNGDLKIIRQMRES